METFRTQRITPGPLTPLTFRPDPKPAPRVRLTRARYNTLVEQLRVKRPLCECGCGRRSQSAHHVLNRRDGEDIEACLLMLNGDGTRGCHGALTSGWKTCDSRGEITPERVRSGIRETMETVRRDVLAYVLDRRGQAWLDRYYPQKDSRT